MNNYIRFITEEEVKDWFEKSELDIYSVFADVCNEFDRDGLDLLHKWIREKDYE
jgi:hypothetical protein